MFQATKCCGTRDWVLRTAMSSPVGRGKKWGQGMYAPFFLTVNRMDK